MKYIVKESENAYNNYKRDKLLYDTVRSVEKITKTIAIDANFSEYIKYVDIYDTIYVKNYQIHNEKGPAWISHSSVFSTDRERYYLFGEFLTKEEWEKQVQTKLYW